MRKRHQSSIVSDAVMRSDGSQPCQGVGAAERDAVRNEFRLTAEMPRYFFDIRDNDELAPDEQGLELPDFESRRGRGSLIARGYGAGNASRHRTHIAWQLRSERWMAAVRRRLSLRGHAAVRVSWRPRSLNRAANVPTVARPLKLEEPLVCAALHKRAKMSWARWSTQCFLGGSDEQTKTGKGVKARPSP